MVFVAWLVITVETYSLILSYCAYVSIPHKLSMVKRYNRLRERHEIDVGRKIPKTFSVDPLPPS